MPCVCNMYSIKGTLTIAGFQFPLEWHNRCKFLLKALQNLIYLTSWQGSGFDWVGVCTNLLRIRLLLECSEWKTHYSLHEAANFCSFTTNIAFHPLLLWYIAQDVDQHHQHPCSLTMILHAYELCVCHFIGTSVQNVQIVFTWL